MHTHHEKTHLKNAWVPHVHAVTVSMTSLFKAISLDDISDKL